MKKMNYVKALKSKYIHILIQGCIFTQRYVILCMAIRKIVGGNIKKFRTAKYWSQEKLSIRSKISHNYLSQLERGEVNVSIDSLERIARSLGVEVEDLVRRTNKQLV